MAEPQGINVPIVITAGVVTTILTFATVEGVCAYYNMYTAEETAAKWEEFHAKDVVELKDQQQKLMNSSSVTMSQAFEKVIDKNKKK